MSNQMKSIQQFAHFDNNLYPFVIQEGTIIDKIPPAYYHVSKSLSGYYLTMKSDSLSLPSKIYGSTLSRAERIWKSYDSTDNPMTVGLFGTKGAGKTLLSNVLASQAIIDRGLPVIDVSSSFTTDKAYLDFLNSLGNCAIVFDEFLKHLSKMGDTTEHSRDTIASDRQDEMLTFFSGSGNSKRLVILIDNSSSMLSTFFKDRPGRMRYMFEYQGVEKEVVNALAHDAKLPNDKIDQLVTYAQRYRCTFDMINEIVKEWALYPEDSLEYITSIMNVPSIFNLPDTKARVVTFKHSNPKITIANDLCFVTTSGKVKFKVNVLNNFFGTNLTEKEFEESEFSEECGYSYYTEHKDSRFIEEEYYVHDYNLVGIKGNLQAYSYKHDSESLDITIEVFERESHKPAFDFSLLV